MPAVLYHLSKSRDFSDTRILRALATAGLVGNIAVSYTHLDVYKRQEERLPVIAHYNYTLRFRSCGLSRGD